MEPAIDEVRIPFKAIAWARPFNETMNDHAIAFWSYTTAQSDLSARIADGMGFNKRRIDPGKARMLFPVPTWYGPPRSVAVLSSIPLYFDWNWLDRVDELNRSIDEPSDHSDGFRTGIGSFGGILSFKGWVWWSEPVPAVDLDGVTWDLFALFNSPLTADPLIDSAWIPILLRRGRDTLPRDFWKLFSDELTVCGEPHRMSVETRWGDISNALKVRGAAIRADSSPAFPFAGSMCLWAVRHIVSELSGAAAEIAPRTSDSTNENLLRRLVLWIERQAAETMGDCVLPGITEAMSDAGVDVLLEFSNLKRRMGFQVKGPRELGATSADALMKTLLRQILESRQYGLYRLILVMVVPSDRPEITQRVQEIGQLLLQSGEGYLEVVSLTATAP